MNEDKFNEDLSKFWAIPSNHGIPYVYAIEFIDLLTAANAQETITLDADSDFELQQIMAITSSDSALDTLPNNFSLQMTNGASSNLLSNIPIQQAIIGGSGYGAPQRMYPSIIFPPKVDILFDVTNISGGDIDNIQIAWMGIKRF